MKKRGLITSLVLMSAALAACSAGDNKPASNESNNTPAAIATAIPAVSKDPVELHFALGTSLMGDIWKGFEDEIKKKYPNYTFKTSNTSEIPNLMLQNTKIDAIITSFPGYRNSILPTGLKLICPMS